MADRVRLNEVIYELARVGSMVRVNAIDPATGTEITTFGPVSAGEEQLKRVALRKLEYVLAKRLRETVTQ